MQGRFGDKLIPDLIRAVSEKGLSGLLRVSRGKAIKAIFFDNGIPVFAISNLGSDQLDRRLVEQGLVKPEHMQQAKTRAEKPHQIGSVLVQMGLLSEDVMHKMMCDQVMDIIFSLFDWTQGDYILEEKIRASHEITLDISATDILLEGARRIATSEAVASLLAPPEAVVERAKINNVRMDSGRMLPIESFIFSRIDNPTHVSEVGALSGLPDEEAYRAICALLAAGFLKIEGREDDDADPHAKESEEHLKHLREEVARKLHFFASADYYEILGVGRQATTAEVKAAYYQLAKRFHPDRHRQLEEGELRSKLDTLFGMMAAAYETLIEPGRRASYDDRIRKSPASAAAAPLKTTPLAHAEPVRPVVADRAASKLSEPTPNGRDSGSLSQEPVHTEAAAAGAHGSYGEVAFSPAADPVIDQGQKGSGGPSLNADQLYQQGRARFERKEYHAAVHLFREAIKLDGNRAPYHFHLGIALIRNPRTRREAEEHLSKAAQLDPYNSQIRVKLGVLYKEMGLSKKAETYFKEALKLDPESKVALRELGAASGSSKDGGSIWKSDIGSIAKKIFKK
ncbi:MAG TPA: DUF4388 domain-containing protein [Blastocatellia bacterium]|nr:DUF4388 domain-containing protein [Blastocatellia bacterium]